MLKLCIVWLAMYAINFANTKQSNTDLVLKEGGEEAN